MYIKEIDCNVVEAAERRVYEAFQKNKTIAMSFSGGKDSICMSDIVIKTMQKYGISFTRLMVIFFDEEAIYPDVEKIVLDWRSKFMSLGAKFYWFCLPIKHYNCCNKLENDESFICWEPGKESVWVRQMPKFAIRNHTAFRVRQVVVSAVSPAFRLLYRLPQYSSAARNPISSLSLPNS